MIIINDDIRINFDEYNWILEERKVNKNKDSTNFGKERWQVLGYYSKIENIFKELLNRNLKNIQEENLKNWIEKAEIENNKIIEICKSIKRV